MEIEAFNAVCAALRHTQYVRQWGGSHVWKVGAPDKNKIFAVAPEIPGSSRVKISFHCSEIAFEMLRDAPGCQPAPYMASRGMVWIQRITDDSISDTAMADYLANSHRLMAAKLTKTLQKNLRIGTFAD